MDLGEVVARTRAGHVVRHDRIVRLRCRDGRAVARAAIAATVDHCEQHIVERQRWIGDQRRSQHVAALDRELVEQHLAERLAPRRCGVRIDGRGRTTPGRYAALLDVECRRGDRRDNFALPELAANAIDVHRLRLDHGDGQRRLAVEGVVDDHLAVTRQRDEGADPRRQFGRQHLQARLQLVELRLDRLRFRLERGAGLFVDLARFHLGLDLPRAASPSPALPR